VIDCLQWLLTADVLPARRHEILGLLLGYSPTAIARHQEREGLWEYQGPEASPSDMHLLAGDRLACGGVPPAGPPSVVATRDPKLVECKACVASDSYRVALVVQP
jgi:hypothetical protein